MSETQLASMFIGTNHSLFDDVEKANGVYSRYGNIVHITDGKTDQILAIATAKNVLDNEHHASLKDNIDTFDIELIGEQHYDEHLLKGNRLIIPAENEGEMVEFVINEVEDIRGHSKLFDVKAYASYLDLQKAKAIKPFTRTGTAREHMFYALADTEFEVGLTESAREITISFENYTDPYEYLKRIAREFELELNFRVVHNGLFVTNRVVDAVVSIGDFRGREVTFGKDLQEIRRLEAGDIYTALIGLGPEREDGSRLEVLVEDLDALRRWGRPEHDPKHLIGVYEPQSEREDMTLSQLRQYTKTELDKRKNSVINYEISFLDLENLIGDDAKKIRKGDTIRIKDTYFTPHLYVEARVLDVKRNAVVPAQKEFILGDFVEYDAETIHDLYAYVKRELTKKAGIQMLLEYAEPKKVESDTAPTIKDGENPIWVDTSKTPNVAHVVNNGEWVKMTPTTPEEVDAYTKMQVDKKANNAEANAKTYADNMKKTIDGEIKDVSDGLVNLDDYINGSFKDGVIEESEARSIEKYINTLTSEKSDIDAQYNNLYNNNHLSGVAKNNLYSAKNNFNTAHGNLINSINDAIADGKTTQEEKDDVDAKFSTYRNYLSMLATRFEEAIDFIAQSKANDAESNANNYTKEYTYDKQKIDEKAQQALDEAKAFSKNAENISEGVIDVGAIPLRTSITGARLEWDGVNGLVQYDMQGNPVSWLDLDANAHFANAFLSGRIEALEGYFGKNQNVTIGDDGLTIKRPDGAIWMQNGMVKQDFTVSGFDPHFMQMGVLSDINSNFDAFYHHNGFYQQYYGALDGRGTPSGATNDIRNADLGYTIRFQRYEFIHSARYFILDFRVANATGVAQSRVRLYEGVELKADATVDRSSGLVPLVVDLGTPTYEKRNIDLRIGWLKNGGPWGNKDSRCRFRVNRIYLADEY